MRLVLDRRAVRRWHLDLLARLAATPGLSCGVVLVEGGNRLPRAMALLFRLEALAYGLAPPASIALAPAGALREALPIADEDADIVLDLSGNPDAQGPARAGRVWRLSYDGAVGERALAASLLAGRLPVAALVEDGLAVASGRLGTEYQGILRPSFEDCLARTATLVVAALTGEANARRIGPPMPDAADSAPGAAIDPRTVGRIALKTMARGAARRLYRLAFHSPQWKVGWRRVEGADVLDLKAHPATGWTSLPDDGRRFYADPFPIEHEGRTFLFVEDYEHRLGKGIISAVEFGPGGPIGRPEPVLETPVHLSYPFVFERDGEVWMIPESCASGTVDLYRATRFPGGWVKQSTLLSGVTASDATLVEWQGRWWMFATVRDGGGGAFSDTLHLWSAPDFRGPFTPHPANPVLIDIASARPAGRMMERGGVLWRPVQDCRNGYGGALGLARIDRLDEEGFAQSVEAILGPGPLWPGRRLHTLNRVGAFEFIDGSGRPPRRF